MERTLVIVLSNGTTLQDSVTAETEGNTAEEVLDALAKYLCALLDNGAAFAVFAGQLIAVDKIVEAYIQES